MLNYLPSASFVPVSLRPLAKPAIAWCNPHNAAQFDPLAFACCQMIEGETEQDYRTDSLTMAGERYGGEGMGSNGGGVRCATDGILQIKGSGKNILAGEGVDFWHSHGGASLHEALREAIWGEVAHIALPLGATRVRAILTTGTKTPYLYPEGPGYAERALIIREAALRPGHFMRSIDFKPQALMRTQFPTDLVRTRHAVQALPAILLAQFAQASLTANILAMAECFARQLAAANAKRLMHGTPSAANSCLDGRWIDFGTASSVSDYGRIILGHNDTPDFCNQHQHFLNTLSELMFYCRKFLPAAISNQLPSDDMVLGHFLQCLQRSKEIEFIKLMGIPETAVHRLNQTLRANLFACMNSLMAMGNRYPFKLAPTHVRTMPEKMGSYQLNLILRRSALASSVEQIQTLLAPHLPDTGLRLAWINAWSALREDWLAQSPLEARQRKIRQMAIHACRLNTNFPELYRYELDARLYRLLDNSSHDPQEQASCINQVISATIARATLLMRDADDDVVANFDSTFLSQEEQNLLESLCQS